MSTRGEDEANLTKVLVSFKQNGLARQVWDSYSSCHARNNFQEGATVLKWFLGVPGECRSGAPRHGVSLERDLVGVLVRCNLRAIKWLKLRERGGPQRDAQLSV